MPITEHQKQVRKNYLGSSDAPAIVGVDPWKTPADIFIEKTQDLQERDFGEAALIGTLCEDAVLKWFSKQTEKKIVRNQFRVHDNGIMAANLDAIVQGEPEIVEAKVIGIISHFDRSQWGEAGTDEIPERYIIQAQHQMAVLGPEYKTVWVPVLLGGVGFVKYRVNRNDDLIHSLEEIEGNFWKNHVKALIPPPESIPHLDVIRAMKRVPKKTIPISSDLIEEWMNAKAIRKTAEENEEEAQRALLAALSDAEAGESNIGTVTYLEQVRAAYQVKENKFRVLKFRRNK